MIAKMPRGPSAVFTELFESTQGTHCRPLNPRREHCASWLFEPPFAGLEYEAGCGAGFDEICDGRDLLTLLPFSALHLYIRLPYPEREDCRGSGEHREFRRKDNHSPASCKIENSFRVEDKRPFYLMKNAVLEPKPPAP